MKHIALGGSLGAVTRFLMANGIYAVLGRGFPYGTLFVNVSGRHCWRNSCLCD